MMLTENIKLSILKQGHSGLSVKVLNSVHVILLRTEEKIHVWIRRRNSWENKGGSMCTDARRNPWNHGKLDRVKTFLL